MNQAKWRLFADRRGMCEVVIALRSIREVAAQIWPMVAVVMPPMPGGRADLSAAGRRDHAPDARGGVVALRARLKLVSARSGDGQISRSCCDTYPARGM